MFIKVLNKIRKYNKNRPAVNIGRKLITGQEASDFIKIRLLSDEPAMICRIGASELDYLINALVVNKWTIRKYFKYIKHEVDVLNWNESIIHNMINWSGFYPHSNENAKKYITLMLNDLKYVDILGSWLDKEVLFKNVLKAATYISLRDLEPYYHPNPWSEILRNKKVLVIHPFEETIKSQYKKRELLFSDQRVLPKFELITLKSVQTIAGNKSEFSNWFEALAYMKAQIDAIDFDIAIIGCGAYGFNLSAHVKRLGKKAVHLGGAVQVLFGVKGKRW